LKRERKGDERKGRQGKKEREGKGRDGDERGLDIPHAQIYAGIQLSTCRRCRTTYYYKLCTTSYDGIVNSNTPRPNVSSRLNNQQMFTNDQLYSPKVDIITK